MYYTLYVNIGQPYQYSYDIIIGSNILSEAGSLIRGTVTKRTKKAVIVTDDVVHDLYAETVADSIKNAGFAAEIFVFPNGEQSKSHENLINLYDFLAHAGITRSDIIVALGGGVVGDLAGFAAATYLRGINYVQVPTTLLAQTDSSVGGKTGVNIPAGKNQVGAFHQPVLVICDTDTLKTLPPTVYANGLAEIIKHGMIYDAKLFDLLNADGDLDKKLPEILERSVSVKINVVERDVNEKRERMKLNFGHTLGHAIEKYNNYEFITHGSAVAIGMSMITEIAERKNLVEKGTYKKLTACLRRHNLPTTTEATAGELYEHCVNDKKRSGNDISIVLCDRVGSSFIKKMSLEEFRKFLAD